MEIPINANVRCADGPCGRATHVVINFHTQQVTHLVVKAGGTPHLECLVPARLVLDTAPSLIRLGCTREDLRGMLPSTKVEWTPITPGHCGPLSDEYLMRNVLLRPNVRLVKRTLVPPGELAVYRGSRVETTDGRVGRLEKLLVDPADRRIIRLVLRTGPLWEKKTVIIPLRRIARIGDEIVSLTPGLPAAEALPVAPMRL
jgi:sporulation protein YlmC with PRC-barrel domain